MSERGSFVTEFVYCPKCLAALKQVLVDSRHDKYLSGAVLTVDYTARGQPDHRNIPIIAGKVGGLYPGEELDQFRFWLIPDIEKTICHPVRIAVLADTGSEIFTITPAGSAEIENE
jgi:hypothetical protein